MFDSIYKNNCKIKKPNNKEEFYSVLYDSAFQYVNELFAENMIPKQQFKGTITVDGVTSPIVLNTGYIQAYSVIIDTSTIKLAQKNGSTFLYNYIRAIGNSICLSIVTLNVTGYTPFISKMIGDVSSLSIIEANRIKSLNIKDFDTFCSEFGNSVDNVIRNSIFLSSYTGSNGSVITGTMSIKLLE